ncbi:MAG: hypothetical protein PWP15_1130 [Methanothermococcus sp.]|uniref:hypothetical protein n=1 Tax=Methanothermococcus sp. TaxID=2614238 RepID=UPI002583C1F1|nr:hypothetical protein [Methanothermococcus sp.]MDK2790623.1 hypothetical protein [Methanothermococcus sp.]
MRKNEQLRINTVKNSIELGNADSIEKIIIRVKTDNPEMIELSVFDNFLEHVDFKLEKTGVEDNSYVRESDNLKGYQEVNFTPVHIFEISGFEPEYPDDQINIFCNLKAKIEIIKKEEPKDEVILEETFTKKIDGETFEMNLKIVKTKFGLEGYLISDPSGVNIDAYGKEDIISRFHDDYLTEEEIELLKEKLKEF